jgi:hypothetical protein
MERLLISGKCNLKGAIKIRKDMEKTGESRLPPFFKLTPPLDTLFAEIVSEFMEGLRVSQTNVKTNNSAFYQKPKPKPNMIVIL